MPMNDFLTAIGLVMILEGLPYFAAPNKMRQMLSKVGELPDAFLRRTGLVLMVLGLFLVYHVRG